MFLHSINQTYHIKKHLHNIKGIQQEEGHIVRRFWSQTQVESFEPEGRAAPVEDSWPWIQISSLDNWNIVSDWYLGLTEDKARANKVLQNIADSLFVGLKTDEEKISKVHDFITDKIRYSSVSFRQAGYVPQSSSKTLNTRVGDCKDMATLGKTLLKLGGVETDLVLVQTRKD